mgnify:CR=1 FL=1
MNLQKSATSWRKIKSNIKKIILAVVLLALLLLMPISWMFPQYRSGANTEDLTQKIAAIVNSYYPVSWENKKLILESKLSGKTDKGLIEGEQTGTQIDSRGGGDVAQIVSVKVQEHELNDKLVNLNIARYVALKITNLAKSDKNYVRCWCVDEDFYAYPACSSVIIVRPYRVETNLYHTTQRCLWENSEEVPTAISEEFTQMSQKIESEIKAELTHK